jgi:hypothetical protein
MTFMEALEAYIQKCKELSHFNSKANQSNGTEEIDSKINGTEEFDDDDDDQEKNDEEDEMTKFSSFLQGFAFQHHSASSNEPKIFPILLRTESSVV